MMPVAHCARTVHTELRAPRAWLCRAREALRPRAARAVEFAQRVVERVDLQHPHAHAHDVQRPERPERCTEHGEGTGSGSLARVALAATVSAQSACCALGFAGTRKKSFGHELMSKSV